jgi:glycerophosphoryl diester phosphodiesterase
LEHQVDEIEIDVRVTKDHVVILHHNPAVRDQSGGSLDIASHTYAELQDHKPDLATLEAAIKAIDRRVKLMIEVKRGEPVKPVIKILHIFRSKGWHNTDFYLASKHQPTLLALHQALPDIPTIVIEPWSGVRAHWRARQIGATRVSMNQLWLWWYFIKAVSRSDFQLYAYTLNDPAKARRWRRYGLAGVITDRPDLFR